MSFSEKLKQLRESRNLTQNALAKCIGISRSAIAMYESGVREPDFHTEEALADFFSISLDDLREWKESSHIVIEPFDDVDLTPAIELGTLIETYRKEHGNMSQRQFADLCGLSNGCIAMIEKGINGHTKQAITPTLDTLNKIAVGTGNTLDSLLLMLGDHQRVSLAQAEFILSPHEEDVLTAYREQPDKQPIVDSVLGVTNVIPLAVAADGGGVEAGKSPDDPDGSQKNGSRGSTDGF